MLHLLPSDHAADTQHKSAIWLSIASPHIPLATQAALTSDSENVSIVFIVQLHDRGMSS
jgi:hypothetical protein